MNGYYGVANWLTYLNMVSGVVGVGFAFGGNIHFAVACLIVAGVCDMFDGTVAKRYERSEFEKNYGIQIDSLADVISFGVLPGAIGMVLNMGRLPMIFIVALYVLAALIRLAYFNVTEIDILGTEKAARTHYEGLPVTSVAIIIPFIYLLSLCFDFSLQPLYGLLLMVIAVLFVLKFRVPKLKMRTKVVLGAVSIPAILIITIKVVMSR